MRYDILRHFLKEGTHILEIKFKSLHLFKFSKHVIGLICGICVARGQICNWHANSQEELNSMRASEVHDLVEGKLHALKVLKSLLSPQESLLQRLANLWLVTQLNALIGQTAGRSPLGGVPSSPLEELLVPRETKIMVCGCFLDVIEKFKHVFEIGFMLERGIV
jgi:hypothetical protein